MTKIDIISGFLGAGKTTLIKKLITEAFAGQKVVLLENEYGQVGIDGGFMKGAGIEVTELNSGCICCTLAGDFHDALDEIVDRFDPERIIIEPSGVGKLSEILNVVTEFCAGGKAEIAGSATVVDVSKCKMYLKNFGEFYEDQLKSAASVIMSRTQSAKPAKIEEAISLIRGQNADCPIVTTPWDDLNGEKILAAIENSDAVKKSLIDFEALMAEGHHHHHHHHEHDEHCDCGCHDHEHHHHHEHDEHCNCGCHDHEHHHHHEHGEHCDCGCHDHEHHHHHEHDEHCDCGCHDHEHHHHHEHDEHCGCGCHEHEHHHHHEHDEHCDCGCHDHEHHHHHHDEHCDCGCHDHEHHHHHEHGEECSCGHHHHHHGDGCSCGHDHDADEVFVSMGIETGKVFERSVIENALNELSDQEKYGFVLRAKGIVPVGNGEWVEFDFVPEEHEIRKGAADYTGRLCIIGADMKQDDIKALFGL